MSNTTKVKATRASELQMLFNNESEKRKFINKYIDTNFIEGIDYGSISVKGQESKPSLFKPGSEKLCSLFKLIPIFSRDNDTWEMLGKKEGLVCYKCKLIKENGEVIAEGRGTALTGLQGDFDVNKQVKIAQKRAQTDAVLRAFALSERFTQDTEDMPAQNIVSVVKVQNRNKVETLENWNSKIMRLYKLMHQSAKNGNIEDLKKRLLAKYKINYMNQLTESNLDEAIGEFEYKANKSFVRS